MQTVMHKTRTDLHFLCDMGQGPLTCLLGYVVAKSLGCPLISAAGTICFRERSLTPRTTKSSFVHDQIDLILPKLDISFHTLAAIMDFATLFSTSGTGLALFSGSHLYLNASVCLHALAHDLKFRQIYGNNDPLVYLALTYSLPIYGTLFWHRLSFVRLGLWFL